VLDTKRLQIAPRHGKLPPVGRFTTQVILLAVVAFTASVASAQAGTMTLYSCHTPSGRSAGTQGWRPVTAYADAWVSKPATDTCASGPAGRLYTQIGGYGRSHLMQERQSWAFATAPNTVLTTYSATVCGRANSDYSTVLANYGVDANGGGMLAQVTAGMGHPTTFGCGTGAPYGSAGWAPIQVSGLGPDASGYSTILVTGLQTTQLAFVAWCQVQPCTETNGVAADIAVRSFRADIRDDVAPIVTAVRGPLPANASHTGTEAVTFNATDRGVGVFRGVVEARINGSGPWRVMTDSLLAPGTACSPLRETASLYEFDSPQPCPTSLSGATVNMDSALLPEGTHQIRVFIEDAAGNQTLVIPPRNYYVPTRASTRAASSPLPAATNGRGASRTAQLRITAPGNRRLLSAGAFRLAGRLLDTDSKPIAGAKLLVQTRTFLPKAATTQGPWGTVGEIVTDDHGVFRGRIPGGASQSLLVTYTAHPGDPSPSANAQTDLVVPAQVTVRAKRTRVRNGRSAVLSGRVSGPIPQGGVLVAMEVREPGRWIPVATTRRWVRTRASGTFTLSYRFRSTFRPSTYRFRVVADEDSAFQYGRGASRAIDIHVRP
jgi:hypothetical protein